MAEHKSRDTSERDDFARIAEWADPNTLHIPKALQKRLKEQGLEYRWIRIHIRGDEMENAPSLIMREREGWKFLTVAECPEWSAPPTQDTTRHKSLISVGDLALAVMPTERAESRRRYIKKLTGDLGASVKASLMKHNTKEMPIHDNSSGMVTKGNKATDFAE